MSEDNNNFWIELVNEEYKVKFESIESIEEPEDDEKTYTIVGYIKDENNKKRRTVAKISKSLYEKYAAK
jgi:hypothetical protein